MLDELRPHLSHHASRGPEQRQRSTCPNQHAYVETLGQFCEEVPKDYRLAVALEREVRREVPTRQMDVRARLTQFLRDRRKGLGAVDQDVDRIPKPHWRRTGGPPSGRRLKRAAPSDPPQTPLMMAADLPRDLIAKPSLEEER